jgi:acyl-coenzyme A thioesterase PaaI-like protein
MDIRTHADIDSRLCGTPQEVGEGFSRIRFEATEEMAADESRLVHGGFIFGLADYAAMLAVNHPNVVLGRAESRFLRPVVVGDELFADAEILERTDNKRLVQVAVKRGDETVFDGEFMCYVLDRHVLAPSPPRDSGS